MIGPTTSWEHGTRLPVCASRKAAQPCTGAWAICSQEHRDPQVAAAGYQPLTPPSAAHLLARASPAAQYDRFTQNVAEAFRYHSMQLKLQRASHRASVPGLLTLGKMLTDSSSSPAHGIWLRECRDSWNKSIDKVSRAGRRTTWSDSFLYELPFGLENMVAVQGNGAVLFGGWQVIGVLSMRAGIGGHLGELQPDPDAVIGAKPHVTPNAVRRCGARCGDRRQMAAGVPGIRIGSVFANLVRGARCRDNIGILRMSCPTRGSL